MVLAVEMRRRQQRCKAPRGPNEQLILPFLNVLNVLIEASLMFLCCFVFLCCFGAPVGTSMAPGGSSMTYIHVIYPWEVF